MKIRPITDERYSVKMVIPMMKYSTFLRFKKNFKAQRGESAASYFERLSRDLQFKNMMKSVNRLLK